MAFPHPAVNRAAGFEPFAVSASCADRESVLREPLLEPLAAEAGDVVVDVEHRAAGVGVDMVTQNTMRGGRSDLSFLIRSDRLDEVIPLCRSVSDKAGGQGVSFATEVAVLSVSIGKADAAAMSRVLAEMFSVLAGAGVNIEIINSTLASVMCMVSLTRADDGIKALKAAFEI